MRLWRLLELLNKIGIHATVAALFVATATYAAPKVGVPWDWQLSETIRPPKGIKVFDADPDSVTRKQIQKLKRAGVYTICYVSVGTLENYRTDVDRFPARVVGKVYGDWPDERFLDIRRRKILIPLMRKRFQRCKRLGFDAVEPDNQDVYSNDSGFNLTARQQVRYLKEIARVAHKMGMEVGQKNVPELTRRLVGSMDFIITESCFQDRWCRKVSAYPRAGKPVFDAEYKDRKINFKKACRVAKRLKISMILKDRNLGHARRACK